MNDKKYYTYCTTKLEYVEVYRNKWHKNIANYPLVLFGAFLSSFLLITGSFFIDGPKARSLAAQNESLHHDFAELNEKLTKFEEEISFIGAKEDSLYRTVLGMEQLGKEVREAGIGGGALHVTNNTKLKQVAEAAQRLEVLESKALVLNRSLGEVFEYAHVNKERLKHTPAIMPIYNHDLKGTGSGFGMRAHPILGIRRMHEGIDFYATTGTDVYATADGVVLKTYVSKTFGNVVVINHGYGIKTLYAHLSKFETKKGQKVKRGEVIGLVGSTGLSSGPHLHYELHINGKEVNPVNYFYADLTPEQYEQIMAITENPDIVSMD